MHGERVGDVTVPARGHPILATDYPTFTRVAVVSAWLLGALAAAQALRLGSSPWS